MVSLPVLIVSAFVSFKGTIGLPSAFNPVLDLTGLPNPVTSTAFTINKRTVRDTREGPQEEDPMVLQMIADEFKWYDSNGDKKVTVDEVRKVWKAEYNVVWSEDTTFKYFDNDNDRALNEKEFPNYFKYGESYFMFQLADTVKDGFLTLEEMRTFLRKWGFPNKVAEKILARDFGKFDGNSDKKWDFNEFDAWFMDADKEFGEEDFKALDADSNGSITPEEMRAWFNSIGAKSRLSHAKLYIQWADENGDVELTLKEYLAAYYAM